MADDKYPSTEIYALKASTSHIPDAPRKTPDAEGEEDDRALRRMFTNSNIRSTHTQHGNNLDEYKELASSKSTLSPPSNSPTPKESTPGKSDDNSNTMGGGGEKRVCTFLPKKCNCSDRLTMQKTKLLLYIFPLSMVAACFYVLFNIQQISMITFLLIITQLIVSYIILFIGCVILVILFQIVLIIRDAIFWCIVKKWNLEQKKAFIQAYSGEDLMEELAAQDHQLHQLRMLYEQTMRDNEEMALMEQYMDQNQGSGDSDSESGDYDESDLIVGQRQQHKEQQVNNTVNEHVATDTMKIWDNSQTDSKGKDNLQDAINRNSDRFVLIDDDKNDNNDSELKEQDVLDIISQRSRDDHIDTDNESITQLSAIAPQSNLINAKQISSNPDNDDDQTNKVDNLTVSKTAKQINNSEYTATPSVSSSNRDTKDIKDPKKPWKTPSNLTPGSYPPSYISSSPDGEPTDNMVTTPYSTTTVIHKTSVIVPNAKIVIPSADKPDITCDKLDAVNSVSPLSPNSPDQPEPSKEFPNTSSQKTPPPKHPNNETMIMKNTKMIAMDPELSSSEQSSLDMFARTPQRQFNLKTKLAISVGTSNGSSGNSSSSSGNSAMSDSGSPSIDMQTPVPMSTKPMDTMILGPNSKNIILEPNSNAANIHDNAYASIVQIPDNKPTVSSGATVEDINTIYDEQSSLAINDNNNNDNASQDESFFDEEVDLNQSSDNDGDADDDDDDDDVDNENEYEQEEDGEYDDDDYSSSQISLSGIIREMISSGILSANSHDYIWGSSIEEREAYIFITESLCAKICINMYRCCPLYRMKFLFCFKMSFELCLRLFILLSLFFFILVLTFVTCNPIAIITPYSSPYITSTYSQTEAKSYGYDINDNIVIDYNDQTVDILQYILNYEQTFTYKMHKDSYFRPTNLNQIQTIIKDNYNLERKTIRIMGAAKSSSYVLTDDNNILIDMSFLPYDPQININNKANCISTDCIGTVTVNASMTVAELNEYLYNFDGGPYVLYGFDSAPDITIGGALGSCSVGPLFNGKSLGYYLLSAQIIVANGTLLEFEYTSKNINGISYLDAIKCNLGLLGVIYQVTFEIFSANYLVKTSKYFYPSYNNFDNISPSSELFNNDEFWGFETEMNETFIGSELFVNPYNNDLLWIKWSEIEDDIDELDDNEYSYPDYSTEEDIFNTYITPISCVFPSSFSFGINYIMNNGKYTADYNKLIPIIYSSHKPYYFVSRLSYIVPIHSCVAAILDAQELSLSSDVYASTRLLPITVTYINSNNNRKSFIGYDNTDSCMITIELNACSKYRDIFPRLYENIIVNKYNGSGHWGYLWYNNDIIYNNNSQNIKLFEEIRLELDPDGIFLSKIYSKQEIISTLITSTYPSNNSVIILTFYIIFIWFFLIFLLYLIASYYRILPFMDNRNLLNFCTNTRDDYNNEYCTICCCDLRCCNDINEMEKLIVRDYENEEIDKNNKEDLIDIDIDDPIKNEYNTISVTFRTAFLISMDHRDESNRESSRNCRDKFAVSKLEELNERYDNLGTEFTWKSIYPRQCLVFSSATISIAMLLCAIIQAANL